MSMCEKEETKVKVIPVCKRGRPRKKVPVTTEPEKTELERLAERNREDLHAAHFTKKFPIPIVFICSPSGGDKELNAEKAKRYSRFAVSRYCVPVTPHLLYPVFLRDDVEKEMKIGQYCGQCLLDKCSELWVFGDVLTNDMEWEIWRAYMRSKKIRWFSEDLKEVKKELPNRCKSLTGPRVKPSGKRKETKEAEAV